jgi:hypothetical protein
MSFIDTSRTVLLRSQERHFRAPSFRVSICAMPAHARPFVVQRNKHIAPKQRRIERLPSGYSVREFRSDSQGQYWYVVTALEVRPTNKR